MAQEIADSKLIDTWSSGGNIVKPDSTKIIEGWQFGEQPPHEYMNWLQNTFGSKLNHILKNGVATWNNKTEYLAGSSVQHNGNVWLCKTTNINSAPTDANANWKRIITVESLENLSVGHVALTGNQTIAGIKTFSSTIAGSINGNAETVTNGVYTTGNQTIAGVKTFTSSPIVPTPTAGTQVANKDYVDSVTSDISTANFTGSNQSKETNGYQKLPGGLIMQWGSYSPSATTTSVSFPIAFPSVCQIVIADSLVIGDTSGVENSPCLSQSQTKTGFVMSQGSTRNRIYWFAIGY